jgi:hypothetical protein
MFYSLSYSDNKALKDNQTIIVRSTNNLACKKVMSITDYGKGNSLKFTVCFCNYKITILLLRVSNSEEMRQEMRSHGPSESS